MPATIGSRNWPNRIRASQLPNPTSAADAAPRMTTDSSSANASQNDAYRTVARSHANDPGELLGGGDDPQPHDPERRHEDDEGAEHHRDHGDARGELAVDDVVAVDRLGEQPRQRALAALAVDAVEPERDADQRHEQRGEGDRGHAADALRADDEQREEQGGRAGQLRRRVADVGGDEVHRHDRGDRDDDEQDEEPDAAEVVGELLGRDRPPAAGRRPLGAAGRARRLRRLAGLSGCGHRWPPGRSGDTARAGPSRVAAGGRWTGPRRRGPRRAAAATSDCAVTIRSRSLRGSGSTVCTPGTARATGSIAAGSPSIATSSSIRWSVPRASSSSGPAATSLPSEKNPTRSHRDWTWPRMCDESRTVRLRSFTSRRSSASSSSTPDGSMAIVGSSRIRTVGLLDQGVGDAEALAHAARVRLGLAVGGVLEADLVEQLVDAGLRDGPRDAVELGGVAQVLAAGQAAVEADVVGQVADLALDRERLAGRVEADDAHDAPGGLGEPEQHQHGRRLAGTVGPQQPEDLARVDREVERVDRGEVAVLLGQPPGDDDGVLRDLREDLGDGPAARRSRGAPSGGSRGPRRGCPVRRCDVPGSPAGRCVAPRPAVVPRAGPARLDAPTSVGRGRRLVGHGATADRTSGRPSRGRRTRPRSAPRRRSTRTAASRRGRGSSRRRWPRWPCRSWSSRSRRRSRRWSA